MNSETCLRKPVTRWISPVARRAHLLRRPACVGIPAGESQVPWACFIRGREHVSPPDESHAERLVMPSGLLMAFVVAAQERPGVRAARHNQRPRGTPPVLHDTGRALRTRTGSTPLSIKSQAEMQARDGPSQLSLRVAASQHDDRRPSVDLRRHTSKGSGCRMDYADHSCSQPLPCKGVRVHIGITSRPA
jgi:hypothetical protein